MAQKKRGDNDTLDEDKVSKQIAKDLQKASRDLVAETGQLNWERAQQVVNQFRPVPWVMWVIIRSVFGKHDDPTSPMTFSYVRPLIFRALEDDVLGFRRKPVTKRKPLLSDVVLALGDEVAAAICFIHSVSRRVSSAMSERSSQPILDDALLRAHIGYFLGQRVMDFGPGKGMLAGFAGRSGLSILVAAGGPARAKNALEKLAAGTSIQDVGEQIYRCDPLQVSAMALTAGGCSRDAAMGVAAFSTPAAKIERGSEQERWLAAFSIIENLRVGSLEKITPRHWAVFGIDEQDRQGLAQDVRQIQRRGHGWSWMSQSLGGIEEELRQEFQQA